ncbi:MAG: glycosyltransferase family 39 protein [Myxococcota bacterium]|nr:glycosyltransferase family 39 protein [Myxococcota bacterium]
MTDTKSSESAKIAPAVKSGGVTLPLGTARRGLTIFGVALAGANVIAAISGGGHSLGPGFSAVLWGAAAMCFLASFVIYMMEPANRRDATAAELGTPKPRGRPAEERLALGETSAATSDEHQTEPSPLFRRGNPLRVVRGGGTALAGCLIAFLLMARHGQLRWGVPLGTLFVALAAWGLMDMLGTFDEPDDRVASSVTLRSLAVPLASFLGASLCFLAALGFATAGQGMPQAAWGVLVTVTFVGAVAALFELGHKLGVWASDEDGVERPLWRRHGFWVVAAAAALYLPFMGSYALWDPWETHYGEVAREMLARDDWISLWWAQDGWFWSKPVLDMWMQAIAMATLGVHYQPDKMLIGDGTRPVWHPEWAVRAPVVLLTILALYLLYKGVAKTFGRRAAFLGAFVLATMPDWYFIAHQTMTDMPFVGAMTACMGLVLLGLATAEDRVARAYEVKVGALQLRFTAWHLVFSGVLLCAIPQILYLLSRNIELVWRPGARGFHPHWDEFRSGSGGGNCGLPGNEECRLTLPASIPHSTGANPDTFGGAVWRTIGAFEPAVQALLWAAVLGGLLYMSWGERRTRRLYYLAAWLFAAISTLGKGPAGFGLPVLITILYLVGSRPGEDFFARFKRIVHELTQFEIVSGLLLIVPVVALPWYVAMYVRHGPPFTDRLIFHDMFNRAFHHVHDTNEGDDTSFRFYLWQLGYAMFPWTGLAPFGLMWWLRRGTTKEDQARADVSVLLFMWFLLAFALFSFMGTKFHHYIFPAVPPVAMLIGVVLDDMLGRTRVARPRALPAYLMGIGVGVVLAVIGISWTQPGSVLGSRADGRPADPFIVIGVVLVAIGVGIIALFVRLFGDKRAADNAVDKDDDDTDDAGAGRSHTSRMLGAGAVAGGLLLVLVARDLIIKPENADQPGAIRLLHLFTYNYRRAWPESLDFTAVLTGFGVVAVVLSVTLAIRAVRTHAVAAICTFAFVWAGWGLDVYMTKTAPHWGQHEVIAAYYADRASPDELIVAYQMNWKGENFYTGNRVPAFVSTGSTFTTWLKQKRDQGAKVMYFITEHGRLGGLKSEVGGKAYREITDKTLCNKFLLVRAEL